MSTLFAKIIQNKTVIQTIELTQNMTELSLQSNQDLLLIDANKTSPQSLALSHSDNDLYIGLENNQSIIVKQYDHIENAKLLGVKDNEIGIYNHNGVLQSIPNETPSLLAEQFSGAYDYTNFLAILGVGAIAGIVTAVKKSHDKDKDDDKNTNNTPQSDTSPSSVSGITTSASSINEGGTGVFTVKLTNTNGNDKLAYTFTGLDSKDYDKITFNNNVTLNQDGTLNVPKNISNFTISVPTVTDKTTEGSETAKVSVGDKTASITINDTSLTPPPDDTVRSLTAQANSVNEGESVQFKVNLSHSNGVNNLDISITGTGITGVGNSDSNGNTDYDYDTLKFSNNVTLNKDATLTVPKGIDSFIITVPIIADRTTEGAETMILNVGSKTANVMINDTSISDITTLTTQSNSVNEGENIEIAVKLENTKGTNTLAFDISGQNIDSKDYGKITFSNTVSLKNGKLTVPKGIEDFTITIPTQSDTNTEGTETLNIKIGTKTTSITIKDTSTAQALTLSDVFTPEYVIATPKDSTQAYTYPIQPTTETEHTTSMSDMML